MCLLNPKLEGHPSMIDFEGEADGLGRRSSIEGCQSKDVGECFDKRFEQVDRWTS